MSSLASLMNWSHPADRTIKTVIDEREITLTLSLNGFLRKLDRIPIEKYNHPINCNVIDRVTKWQGNARDADILIFVSRGREDRSYSSDVNYSSPCNQGLNEPVANKTGNISPRRVVRSDSIVPRLDWYMAKAGLASNIRNYLICVCKLDITRISRILLYFNVQGDSAYKNEWRKRRKE